MSKLITTPKGKAIYPHVNEADTKFDANGKYTCDILVPAEDAEPLLEELERQCEAEYEKTCEALRNSGKKKMPRRAPMPIEEDEEGMYIVKCRRPAKVISKKNGKTYEFSIKLFDAKGQPTKAQVGSGSVVRTSVEPYFWTSPSLGFGMSLRLQAVQILELVEPSGGGNADSFGFAEEDGSFVSEGESFDDTLQDSETNGDF